MERGREPVISGKEIQGRNCLHRLSNELLKGTRVAALLAVDETLSTYAGFSFKNTTLLYMTELTTSKSLPRVSDSDMISVAWPGYVVGRWETMCAN